MFDLSNLNDYEFELLCKDIMMKILAVDLYTFPRGVDGGIDICDAEKKPNFVIQAKHFSKSKYTDLRYALKNEVDKVKRLNPKQYFICTSLELTKANKDEIIKLFDGYIKDRASIVAKAEIDSFLESEKNKDIVNKHYKLWLCASNVLSLINNQDVFIDCDELMSDIESHRNFFVDTTSYYEAQKKLIENKVIIITGTPGVGKSTISKMLLLHFVKNGYVVRYVTNNIISNIKKVLTKEPTKKEIILLDDFLGQYYLKLNESQPNELKTLISFVENRSSKKLIMNTRITIFNQAVQSFLPFRELMEKHENDKYLIDLDKMPLLEKAKILYNHLYFNNLPPEYFLSIKQNKNYLQIVQHTNYNPRLIEYVTKEKNYCQVSSKDYYDFFLSKLNNPEDVWRDEFNNRLHQIDRMMMNTLYSLTDASIEIDVFKDAFNKRISNDKSIDKTYNIFTTTLTRLSNSLLKLSIIKGKTYISVINPSVNDYMNAEITANPVEQYDIITSAKYIEQVVKMDRSEDAKKKATEYILDGSLLKMAVQKNSPSYYFLSLVVELDLFNKKMQENFLQAVEGAHRELSNSSEYGKLFIDLLKNNFYDFYQVKKIFQCKDTLHSIVKPMSYEHFCEFIDLLVDFDHFSLDYSSECIEILKNQMIENIIDAVESDTVDDFYEIVSNHVPECSNSEEEDNEDDWEDRDNLHDAILSDFFTVITIALNEYIKYRGQLLQIKITDFNIDDMLHYTSIDSAIREVSHPTKENYDNKKADNEKSDISAIEELFER